MWYIPYSLQWDGRWAPRIAASPGRSGLPPNAEYVVPSYCLNAHTRWQLHWFGGFVGLTIVASEEMTASCRSWRGDQIHLVTVISIVGGAESFCTVGEYCVFGTVASA